MPELDLSLPDGRTLHVYDTGPRGPGELAVFWHHGTPNLGAPPRPLFAASEALDIRWVSYDRPGYGGSTPLPGRTIADAAFCVRAIADALGIERFAAMGHSGGGPHALACAALLPGRVVAAVSGAGLAPFGAEGLEWFAGMIPSGVASLRAAAAGRDAKIRREASGASYDPEFTPADLAALEGEWGWLGEVANAAAAAGKGGLIDDDLAYVAPWGFDAARIAAPVLLLHGERDGIVPAAHSVWLARRCAGAELRLFPEDGHVSVLRAAPAALAWLRAPARAPRP